MKLRKKSLVFLSLTLIMCTLFCLNLIAKEKTMKQFDLTVSIITNNTPSFLECLRFSLEEVDSDENFLGEYTFTNNTSICKFKNVSIGKYLLTCTPDAESYSGGECIFSQQLNITKNREKIKLDIPSGKATLEIKFKKNPPLYKNRKQLIAKVQRIKKGRVDLHYLQYLFFRPLQREPQYWTGNLYNLDVGQYKITFFTRENEVIKDLLSLKMNYKEENIRSLVGEDVLCRSGPIKQTEWNRPSKIKPKTISDSEFLKELLE